MSGHQSLPFRSAPKFSARAVGVEVLRLGGRWVRLLGKTAMAWQQRKRQAQEQPRPGRTPAIADGRSRPGPKMGKECVPSSSRLVRPLSWTACGLLWAGGLFLTGCERTDSAAEVEVIGRRGVDKGHFSKPRAIELDANDQLYVVDMTGRIQVLNPDGEYLRSWRTPDIANGKPCGLGFSRDGLLMVADTHYFRILFYEPDGTPVPERTIGGSNGRAPGEFGFVTDAVQDSAGNYYVAEYGDFDRIQKFDSAGTPICQWGEHGSEPGQFLRPQALAIDESNQLWVADACNHRLQIFDLNSTPPSLVRIVGREGTGPGELKYPYGIWLGPDDTVLVAEFGNHRVQKLRRSGESLATFGTAGRATGQFHQPWSLVLNSQGDVIVLDSYNHRLQKFRFDDSKSQERGTKLSQSDR